MRNRNIRYLNNDAIKGPNWVSWQVNKSWLGDLDQGDIVLQDRRNYPPTGFPPNYFSDSTGVIALSSPDSSYPASYFVDYPWVADPLLPDTWVKTQGPDYRLNQRGFDRGHMSPAGDRSRTFKDIYSTFTTTNVLPQHQGNNRQGTAWAGLENHARNQLVDEQNRELYIIRTYAETLAVGCVSGA